LVLSIWKISKSKNNLVQVIEKNQNQRPIDWLLQKSQGIVEFHERINKELMVY